MNAEAKRLKQRGRPLARPDDKDRFKFVGYVRLTQLEDPERGYGRLDVDAGVFEIPVCECPRCGALIIHKILSQKAHKAWCAGWNREQDQTGLED